MDPTELTPTELDLLLEALQMWDRQSPAGEPMPLLSVVAGMVGMSDDQRADAQRKYDEFVRDEHRKARLRKERSVLLQAKLIAMRDSQVADAMTRTSKED